MTKGKKTTKYYPFVSVCTPTFNRRPFIENMLQCFKNQNYPKNRIEWIIVDDGTDKINDLISKANISQIKYYSLPEKVSLGKNVTSCIVMQKDPLLSIWMMTTTIHPIVFRMRSSG